MNNKLNSGALTGRFPTKTSFIQLFSANRRGRVRGRAEWNLKTSCVIMIVRRSGLVLRLIIYMTGHGKTGDGATTRGQNLPANTTRFTT